MPAEPTDPVAAAARLSAPAQAKRFYERAEAVADDGAFAIALDGRRARTPGGRPLVLPDRTIAAAAAAEWAAQGERIDPATMPLTRLANSAIDGVAERMPSVRDAVLAFAASDLLCYRAGEPAGLAARQRALWDPILAAVERRYGARFVLAEGVVPVAQPAATLAALAQAFAAFEEPFRLTALHLATTLTGSALIALALAAGDIDAEAAWTAAHVDEDWNIAQWGADAEAAARRAGRRRDFDAAALVLAA